MLIAHPKGHYRFLQGIDPYSCGVVAEPGWEIVRVVLAEPLPWREGFERVDAHLVAEGYDRVALCAMELLHTQIVLLAQGWTHAADAELRAGSKDWQTIFRGVAGPLRCALRLDRESKRCFIFCASCSKLSFLLAIFLVVVISASLGLKVLGRSFFNTQAGAI